MTDFNEELFKKNCDMREFDMAQNYVHIRINQRNGRKSITSVSGLPENLDLKKILSALMKKYGCGGAVIKHKSLGTIIQLSGDQRKNILDILVSNDIYPSEGIKIHGF